MTNKALHFSIVVSIILMINACGSTDNPDNPLIGQWRCLWPGSKDKSLNFQITFKRERSFQVEVTGKQIKPEKVLGRYQIKNDTLMVMDILDVCHRATTSSLIVDAK